MGPEQNTLKVTKDKIPRENQENQKTASGAWSVFSRELALPCECGLIRLRDTASTVHVL